MYPELTPPPALDYPQVVDLIGEPMYTFRTQFMALHFHYLLPLHRCPRHRPHFLDGTAHIEYVEYLTRSFLHHTMAANTQLITITMSLLQIPHTLRLSYTCLLIHPITNQLRSQLILYAYALTDTISQHRDWFIKDIDGVSHFRPPPPSLPIPSHPPYFYPKHRPPLLLRALLKLLHEELHSFHQAINLAIIRSPNPLHTLRCTPLAPNHPLDADPHLLHFHHNLRLSLTPNTDLAPFRTTSICPTPTPIPSSQLHLPTVPPLLSPSIFPDSATPPTETDSPITCAPKPTPPRKSGPPSSNIISTSSTTALNQQLAQFHPPIQIQLHSRDPLINNYQLTLQASHQIVQAGPYIWVEGIKKSMPPRNSTDFLTILQQNLQLQLDSTTNIATLTYTLQQGQFPYAAPDNQGGLLLRLAPQQNYHFGLHHSPSSRLIFRIIHYGIEISPTEQFVGYATATILPPYVNPYNSTELGSDPLCWIRGGENIPAQANTHSSLLLDIQTNILAQLAMVTRTMEALLPHERIFILPRRVTTRYPGSNLALTETVLQVRICKNYTHQPPQLPVFANSIVRTSQARLRLGLTQDRPSRLLVTGGYSFELLHPDGTPFPSSRSPLPHYSLRFAQPYVVIAGIAPGYTPDQILAALYQHDQLATQTAQTEGYRPPITIAENIHLVVCCPGSLDPRPLNAGQPPRPDSWFLYFNAGVQLPQFAPTSAIIALGTGYRRPNIILREDSYYTRSFREAAARNPATQDQHILRPYSYAAATGVQADIIRINALAEALIPELDLPTHYSPPTPNITPPGPNPLTSSTYSPSSYPSNSSHVIVGPVSICF